MTTFKHRDGMVSVSELDSGRRKLSVQLRDPAMFSPLLECETNYPDRLLQLILDVKGPAWICDEIGRDEDPNYVLKHLELEMRAFFSFDELAGKSILDFGCGSGASTMQLAKLFPASSIVGVELEEDLLKIAEARRAHYGFENVRLLRSRSGKDLPEELGTFDLIVLSAVYEHLLPDERTTLLPRLWSIVNDNGILFIDQTPHRYFPIELHTTSLPLINFLPDGLTLAAARRFSRRVGKDDSWESLLRAGIRGATTGEIRGGLSGAKTLEPTLTGLRDPIDLWFATTDLENKRRLKRFAKRILQAIYTLTGVAIVPELTLAFRKGNQRRP